MLIELYDLHLSQVMSPDERFHPKQIQELPHPPPPKKTDMTSNTFRSKYCGEIE